MSEHIGSDFDDFLAEQGMKDEVVEVALNRLAKGKIPTDTRNPKTAFLSMHIDLIREAGSDVGARLSARGAEGYLVALYDLDRIQASEYAKFQDEIIRLKTERIAQLKATASKLEADIRAIEQEMQAEREE